MKTLRFAVAAAMLLGLGWNEAEAQVPAGPPLQPPLVIPRPNVRAIRPRVLVQKPHRRPHRRRRPPVMNRVAMPRVPF